MDLFEHSYNFKETRTWMQLLDENLHILVAKALPPKLAGLCLVHPVSVTLIRALWKHGLQLPQNVAEQ